MQHGKMFLGDSLHAIYCCCTKVWSKVCVLYSCIHLYSISPVSTYSVGIEDVKDLIQDLQQALDKI